MAKVLIAVGDTAERVSNRKLDPLPNVLACEVLRESLGREVLGLGEIICCFVRMGGVTTIGVVILFEDSSWWCENDWANILWEVDWLMRMVCDPVVRRMTVRARPPSGSVWKGLKGGCKKGPRIKVKCAASRLGPRDLMYAGVVDLGEV